MYMRRKQHIEGLAVSAVEAPSEGLKIKGVTIILFHRFWWEAELAPPFVSISPLFSVPLYVALTHR